MLHLPTLVLPLLAAAGEHDPASYLRLVEDGERLSLELCVREFRVLDESSEASGPRVFLASAMHIADERYYDTLQRFLDGRDVVLFERVEETGRDEGLEDLSPANVALVRATERRLRAFAVALERYAAAWDAYPESLDAAVERLDGRARRRLEGARVDTWGYRLSYAADDSGFRLWSLGADGAKGGDGVNSDLTFADQPPVHDAEIAGDAGLQKDLADALDLVFQLDGIDYNGASWRNSDMTIAEVVARLDASGVDAGELFGALSGKSAMSRLAGGMLKLLGASRSGSGMLKIIGIEALARADELLTAAPGQLGAMLDVLIRERNGVVLRDLEELLVNEPEVDDVAVFFGAGHMLDLEKRMVDGLGFRPTGDTWLTAVSVDLASTGLPKSQIRWMRDLVGDSLDKEIEKARRAR